MKYLKRFNENEDNHLFNMPFRSKIDKEDIEVIINNLNNIMSPFGILLAQNEDKSFYTGVNGHAGVNFRPNFVVEVKLDLVSITNSILDCIIKNMYPNATKAHFGHPSNSVYGLNIVPNDPNVYPNLQDDLYSNQIRLSINPKTMEEVPYLIVNRILESAKRLDTFYIGTGNKEYCSKLPILTNLIVTYLTNLSHLLKSGNVTGNKKYDIITTAINNSSEPFKIHNIIKNTNPILYKFLKNDKTELASDMGDLGFK